MRATGIEVEEVIDAAGLVAAAGPSFHRAIRSLRAALFSADPRSGFRRNRGPLGLRKRTEFALPKRGRRERGRQGYADQKLAEHRLFLPVGIGRNSLDPDHGAVVTYA